MFLLYLMTGTDPERIVELLRSGRSTMTLKCASLSKKDAVTGVVRIGLGESFISGGSMTRPQFVDSLIESHRSFPCVAHC